MQGVKIGFRFDSNVISLLVKPDNRMINLVINYLKLS